MGKYSFMKGSKIPIEEYSNEKRKRDLKPHPIKGVG